MDSSLTPTERSVLAEAAATMIPAAPQRGLPGAGDPAIMADIER